jgi:hypothetical protein
MRTEPFITDLALLKEQEHMYDTDDYKTFKPVKLVGNFLPFERVQKLMVEHC